MGIQIPKSGSHCFLSLIHSRCVERFFLLFISEFNLVWQVGTTSYAAVIESRDMAEKKMGTR